MFVIERQSGSDPYPRRLPVVADFVAEIGVQPPPHGVLQRAALAIVQYLMG